MPRKRPSRTSVGLPLYDGFVGEIADLLAAARRASARAVNALMTATYWEIGRRIVEFEQGGAERAEYGEELLERLAADLTARFGRGFSRRNLQSMRLFYAAFPPQTIWQTLSAKSAVASAGPLGTTLLQGISGMEIEQTTSAKFVNQICSTSSNNSETPSRNFDRPPLSLAELARALPLPWSQYVLLISRSRSPEAMEFYHAEALRGGWSVRQLQRQIDSQFYERTALSRDKAKMLMAPQVTQRTAASASGPQDFLISSAEFGHSTGELRTSRTTRYRPRWQRPLRTRGWAKACRHCTAHENGRLLANRMRATSQPQ
jgi:hypothetical protein